MYRKLDDFLEDYTRERAHTLDNLERLTPESLEQRVAPEFRTLGQLAWHIAATIPEMINRTGLDLDELPGEVPEGTTPEEITSVYDEAGRDLLKKVESEWNDDTLAVTDELYGEEWPRGLTLDALVKHEVHHRGQMLVLMRQANLEVHGPYGPAKEEWEQHGQEPPA